MLAALRSTVPGDFEIASVRVGSRTSASESPRKRATRTSMSGSKLGSDASESSHQSGKITGRTKSRLNPALDRRLRRFDTERVATVNLLGELKEPHMGILRVEAIPDHPLEPN